MNENKNYQDDFQKPVGVEVKDSNSSSYNDTYYDQSYSDNKYNEYEEPKKKLPWKIIIIIILALIFIFLFWYFLFGGGANTNVNLQYEKLSDELCEKAKEYADKKPDIIDTDTPGATAYVKLQQLVDEYMIPSTPIKDPRYKRTLFSKPEGKEFLSFDSYLRLFVMPNGEVSCEGLVDTGEDHTQPILSLKGTTPVIISKGTNFEDPGAKAVDDVDGDITDKIVRSGSVDTMTIGEYIIKYSVSDTSGNTTNIERKIIVQEYEDIEVTIGSNFDSITPQIELKGSNPYCMEVGQKYKEPGAIATDNIDGNITDRIKVDSSAVTGLRNGNFRVTYEVSDTYGHKAIAYRSVMVRTECVINIDDDKPKVNTRPQVHLKGKTSITIDLNKPYSDLGATAWDKEDGAIKAVMIRNTVNVNKAGIYEVVYKATDSGGLSASAKRIVTVKDPNAISNVASFVEIPKDMRIPLGQATTIPKPAAKDSYGKVLEVTQTIRNSSEKVVSAINFNRIGTYRIEYSAKPNGGVTQVVHRNVTIYDDKAPILNIGSEILVLLRTTNCNLTVEDLKMAGMTVTDAPNEVAPEVIITGGENTVCAINTNGIDIEVYAKDDSNNKSPVKKVKLYIVNSVDPADPTNVEIGNCGTNGELDMFVGDQATLTSKVYPINASDKSVTWTSELTQYATVDQTGKVVAVAKGSTYITVKTVTGGHTATCHVIVRERTTTVPVTGVDIEGCESGSMTIKKGAVKELTAIITPTDASNKSVSWTSSNNSVLEIATSKCIDVVEGSTTVSKCMNGSTGMYAKEVGTSTLKVTTEDGNKTKECVVTVVPSEEIDTTAPQKVIVIANNANTSDPYNKAGNWLGGNLEREVKITVRAIDPESKITKFIAYDSAGKEVASFTPEVNVPDTGLLVIKEDTSSTLTFEAVNEANLKSEKSDSVIVKLDNTGPKTTYETWIEDPNKWVSSPSVTVKYNSVDSGNGIIEKYEYTHDDVKAKAINEIKIEGSTQNVEMIFSESNINKYVYVRAIDKLGNIGPWTDKPSYLNMDTVAPAAPGLAIVAGTNNTTNVKVQLSFTDSPSPKMSGFGKYEWYVNNAPGVTETNESAQVSLTSPGSYTLRAWSYDKAGNKSASFGELTGIVVTSPPAPTPEPTPKPTPKPTPPPGTITLTNCSSGSVTINQSETFTLSATATTGYTVTSCSITSGGNPGSSIESGKCTLIGKTEGYLNYCAYAKDSANNVISNCCKVSVNKPQAVTPTVTISKCPTPLVVNRNGFVVYTTTGYASAPTASYTSSNPSVAVVAQNGYVTGKGAGQAVISLTVTGVPVNGTTPVSKTTSCAVTITPLKQVTEYRSSTCTTYNTCSTTNCGCASVYFGSWSNVSCYGTSSGCSSVKPANTTYTQYRCETVSGCGTSAMLQKRSGSCSVWASCPNQSCGCQTWSGWSSWTSTKCTPITSQKKCETRTVYQ